MIVLLIPALLAAIIPLFAVLSGWALDAFLELLRGPSEGTAE